MSRRTLICGIIAMLLFLNVLGLTGSAELGNITLGEYTIYALMSLVLMAVAIVIGDERYKKNRRD